MKLGTLFLLSIIICILTKAGFVYSHENQKDTLKLILEKLFSPKRMDFYMEASPNGYFKRIYIEAESAVASGLPLEKVEIEAEDVELNPSEEWKRGEIRVLNAKDVRLIMVISEENLNCFLREKIRENKIDGLKNANAKIKRDFLYLVASYQIDALPLRILVELKSKLGMEESKIILRDYKLYLSGLSAGEDFTHRLLSKINPVFDLKTLPFPVKRAQLEQLDGKIIIKTAELPQKPFPLSTTRSDDSNSPHIGN